MKQEQQAIDAQFEKKRKNAEVAQKMFVLHPWSNTVSAMLLNDLIVPSQL